MAVFAAIVVGFSMIACGEESVQGLTDDLKSSNVEVRRRAAGRLKSHGKAAAMAVPALIASLRDPDRHVRGFAAQTLGGIGPAAQSAASTLAEVMVSDESPFTRSSAVRSLGLIQANSTQIADAIVGAVETGRVHWLAARGALERMGQWGADAYRRLEAPELLARVARDHQDVDALTHLAGMGAKASTTVSILAEILARPGVTHELRDLAAKGLGGIGPGAQDAIGALEAAATAGSVEAATALVKIRGK